MSKFGYLRPRKKKSRVEFSGETGIRASGNACNQTEVDAQQFEDIDRQQKFFQMHCQMLRRMGRGKSTA